MRKVLKKALVSVMAVATIAVSVGGMNVSAADATVAFAPASTATLYRTSTTVSASTSCTRYCYIKTAKITSTSGGTITSGTTEQSIYNNLGDTANATGYGTGFTSASSYHYVSTSEYGEGYKYLTV